MRDQGLRPSLLSVVLSYLGALAYWVMYFVKGHPAFTANDWMKEQVFSNLVRDALHTGQLPWRMSVDFYHGAGVFELIANPEVSLTPDFLMLGILPNNTYFLLHWLLFFTAGFIGTVFLAKRYSLSSLSFVFFVALFNFNGFIGAHVSEGHIQWAGYFLFPWFFYWLSDFSASDVAARTQNALKVGLLLGIMFMNGSFHMAIWCLMLLVLVLIYRRDLVRPIGLVIVLAGLLGVARLVPAAFYFPPKTDFVSGYPTISTLLDALTYIYHPESPARGGSFGNLAWHEYCFYIGYVGLVFLATGAYEYAKGRLRCVPVWWIPAALVMFLFAMGDVYQMIPNSGLPFTTIERVASRFMVMPFCILLLIAAVGFTHLQKRHQHYTTLALFLALFPMMGEFFQNARNWRIQSYEAVAGFAEIPVVTIVESQDQFLRLIVGVSWSISLVTALVAIVWLLRVRKA